MKRMKDGKDMLSFVDALKHIIADIDSTGGAAIERTSPSHQLLQQLREYAIQSLRKSTHVYYLEEWFFGGYFEEHVRACIVYLHKLGIMDDDRVYHLLSKVIEMMIGGRSESWPDQESFERQLVDSLEIVWYEGGDEQTYLYTVAESRWLIGWDYQKSQWKTTGLGRVFIDLSPVQASVFLLSIDTLLATEYDYQHMSCDVLRRLQSLKPDHEEQFIQRLYDSQRTLLTRLGIFISERSPDDLDAHVRITPIGQVILDAVLSENNVYRDVALALIQAEEVGETFNVPASEISGTVDLVNQSDLVDQANRELILQSVQHYRAKEYLASCRVILPTIEAIADTMLTKAGEHEQIFSLAKKAKRLWERGNISLHVFAELEIAATIRNKVEHGNISSSGNDVQPLCQLAFMYLRSLLAAYHPVE
jgi:hypothetical protein